MTITNTSYKDSGIAWIGKIPKEWEVVKLKNIASLYTGNSIKDSEKDNYPKKDNTIPYISTKNITYPQNKINYKVHIYTDRNDSSFKVAPSGSILLCVEGGSAGKKIAYTDQEVSFVNKLCCIIPKNGNKYLYYYTQSICFKSEFELNLSGLIGGVSQSYLKNFDVIVSPPPIQTAIANYLDTKNTQISEFIARKKQLISLLVEQKQAIIHQAVTKGIDPSAKMKESGIAWIGQIPEGWEVRRLKMLSNIKRGASPRPIDDKKYFDENGEFAWVRISDVTASDMYLLETEQQLSELGASLSVKQYPGDLFLSIAGSVGKPIIAKIKCCIHDGFVTLGYISEKVDKMFLYYILASGLAYAGLGKEGTQLNLNIDTVGNITIPLPSIDIQKKVIQYIVDKNTKIDQAITKIEQEIDLIQEYRTSLIYHAVTGKIDID